VGNKPKHNSRPKDVCWPQRKICFMHVNKVASNSLNHALPQILGKETEKKKGAELPTDEDWLIFAFVRDPWDRLLSAYTHNIIQGKVTGPQEARGFVAGMSLTDYVLKIMDTPDIECDKHYVPQAFRLGTDDGRLVPNWIGKMEKLPHDWVKLTDLLTERTGEDCKWPLRWMKKRKHYRQRIGVDIDSDRLKELVKQRYLRDYQLFYPDQL